MTSVPKPLKFLSPHYATVKAAYEAQTDATLKVRTPKTYFIFIIPQLTNIFNNFDNRLDARI